MERILITGVCGFIGYHTAIRFLQEGFNVVGIDNLNSHYDPMLKYKRLEILNNNFKNNFRFFKIDITKKHLVENLFKKEKYKIVVNLAARAGVRNSLIKPLIYYKTNVIGVLNLLESIKKYSPETLFIHSSSSSVYGNNRKVPFSEDNKVDNPISPYAASKKASEELCYTYFYLYNINMLVFRFFTVYGPYGRPDMAYFKFIKLIAENKPIHLYGDGTQKRDFTYVDDIVNGIYKGRNFRGFEIINLGNNTPIKINKLINIIETKLNRKARIINSDLPPEDMKITYANIEKAKKILNWKPEIKIEDGIDITIKWYIKNQNWLEKIKLNN